MPYCQIELYDQNSVDEPPPIMTKHQTILIKLDSQKFKNVSPEKAEGWFSIWYFEIAIWSAIYKHQVENPRKNSLKNLATLSN